MTLLLAGEVRENIANVIRLSMGKEVGLIGGTTEGK